jgi:hypothetical protein
MLVERLVFQVKYGQDLVSLVKGAGAMLRKTAGVSGKQRVLTDTTGKMFTVVWETEYKDWDEFAASRAAMQKMFGTKEFRQWFEKMQAVTESGHRELYNVE